MKSLERRSLLKKTLASLLGIAGLSSASRAESQAADHPEKICRDIVYQDQVPLFSSSTTFGNLVFIAGKGAHFEGDIKAHTDHVLNELKAELEKAGSSMEKVLKVNVYLADLADYKAMNEVFQGR